MKERKSNMSHFLSHDEIPAGDVLVSAWPVHPPYLRCSILTLDSCHKHTAARRTYRQNGHRNSRWGISSHGRTLFNIPSLPCGRRSSRSCGGTFNNREKLRSLVGYVYTAHTALFGECILTACCSTRYRELLGTAETIIDMNMESSEVESRLSQYRNPLQYELDWQKSVNLTDINRESTGRTEETKLSPGNLRSSIAVLPWREDYYANTIRRCWLPEIDGHFEIALQNSF